MTTLLLSQGVPMIVAGDECRRTQLGNNNAYCQDNEISWFDWDLADKNSDLVRFCRGLIRFRRQQPTVRRRRFLAGHPTDGRSLPDVSWFNAYGQAVDWHGNDLALICLLLPPTREEDPEGKGREVLLLVNANAHSREFILPAIAKGIPWRLFVDTAATPPYDIYPDLDGPHPPKSSKLLLASRSLCCYVAQR